MWMYRSSILMSIERHNKIGPISIPTLDLVNINVYIKSNQNPFFALKTLKENEILKKRTMMVLYRSPEQIDLHTYRWSFSQVHCSKIFV